MLYWKRQTTQESSYDSSYSSSTEMEDVPMTTLDNDQSKDKQLYAGLPQLSESEEEEIVYSGLPNGQAEDKQLSTDKEEVVYDELPADQKDRNFEIILPISSAMFEEPLSNEERLAVRSDDVLIACNKNYDKVPEMDSIV